MSYQLLTIANALPSIPISLGNNLDFITVTMSTNPTLAEINTYDFKIRVRADSMIKDETYVF